MLQVALLGWGHSGYEEEGVLRHAQGMQNCRLKWYHDCGTWIFPHGFTKTNKSPVSVGKVLSDMLALRI